MRRIKTWRRFVDVTEEQAKVICECVIDQAIDDFQAIPNDCPSADEKRRAERDWESANRFFFDEDSSFRWMAKAIDADVDVLRAALLERGQPQPSGSNTQFENREPGRSYGSFVDRAARAVA